MGNLDLNLVVGLIIFMAANIGLGSVDSVFNGTFNKTIFWIGIGKAFIITICFTAMAFAASLNPNVFTTKINDVDVNALTTMNGIILAGYIAYATQGFNKLRKLIIPKKEK